MKIINKIRGLLGLKQSHINYWKQRAINLGERSVINTKYDLPIDEVTNYQMEQIFPFLVNKLKGNEKNILDFGCGSGRFTSRLSKICNLKAIGIDPIQTLIDFAKKNDSYNDYFVSKNNKIPLQDISVDIVWVCLVMGGIPEGKITLVQKEISRVLKDDGLLILVENTSNIKNSNYWSYRTPLEYIALFKDIDLIVEGNYKEVDEDITIMTGRKKNISYQQ